MAAQWPIYGHWGHKQSTRLNISTKPDYTLQTMSLLLPSGDIIPDHYSKLRTEYFNVVDKHAIHAVIKQIVVVARRPHHHTGVVPRDVGMLDPRR